MQKLNLPHFNFKIKSTENKYSIFDIVRKKYIILTPEEWVRQHIIHYLIEIKKYPISLLAVEKQLTVNNLKKRADIVVYSSNGKPHIIVECKASTIKINQPTFDQIARYNLKLNANYLMVTNGLEHYYCKINAKKEQYNFLKDIPNYSN